MTTEPAEQSIRARAAKPSDVDEIRRLVRAAYEPYVARIGVEPAPMHADYESIIARRRALVVEDNGTLIGLLVLEPTPDHLMVENVAVAPGRTGEGIGTELLRLAEQMAQALSLPRVCLYTNAKMTENLAYYPRRGFCETHREMHQGYDRVFFVKEVETQPGSHRG